MATDTDRADVFEAERARLTAAAYRMLGSWAEAEDAVQEAWLRFSQAQLSDLREPRAWLTTVVGRICLDVLRSARVRREAYVGPWLPEPLVTRLPDAGEDGADPADVAARHDELGFALLVILERLTPEQRVALVLHDVFAVPFAEIAAALGTTAEAARQLATRARQAVVRERGARSAVPLDEQRRVVTAFLAAARSGDLDGLLAVLAPDVVIVGDGGGIVPAGRSPLEGALAVARFMLGLFRRAQADATVEFVPALVNGEVGLVGEVRAIDRDRVPTYLDEVGEVIRVVMAFDVADGRVQHVYDQLNPTKLVAVPTVGELTPQPSGG